MLAQWSVAGDVLVRVIRSLVMKHYTVEVFFTPGAVAVVIVPCCKVTLKQYLRRQTPVHTFWEKTLAHDVLTLPQGGILTPIKTSMKGTLVHHTLYPHLPISSLICLFGSLSVFSLDAQKDRWHWQVPFIWRLVCCLELRSVWESAAYP